MSKENIYVFFTRTGKEDKAANEIKETFKKEEITPFNLWTELFFKKHGEVYKEIKPMFPGYLFTTSHMDDEEFIQNTREIVRGSKNIIKLLQYGNSGLAAIKREERDLLENLLQGDNYIKSSCGYIRGDKIIITDGPFVGRESVIKSIDRHKMQATLELDILGEIRKVIIGLEIIKKYNR